MTNATLFATLRLGAMLSVVAAGLAAGLSLVGDVSQWSLVVAVATASFVLSWIQVGRVERADDHRLAVILADTRVGRALG
ncbi:MAG: hypothetical protein CL424_20660 [Acidimicrobiaceae bacterium]|nr:hypothetical protein [Acidimicrobiaceae bacterium]